jgi:hypothetical protein
MRFCCSRSVSRSCTYFVYQVPVLRSKRHIWSTRKKVVRFGRRSVASTLDAPVSSLTGFDDTETTCNSRIPSNQSGSSIAKYYRVYRLRIVFSDYGTKRDELFRNNTIHAPPPPVGIRRKRQPKSFQGKTTVLLYIIPFSNPSISNPGYCSA